jgi:hypothetical protein
MTTLRLAGTCGSSSEIDTLENVPSVAIRSSLFRTSLAR